MGKITRYIEEPIKIRVVDSLRPTTKAPSEAMLNKPKPSKKVLAKRKEKKKEEQAKKKKKYAIAIRKILVNVVLLLALLYQQLAIKASH